MNEITMSNLPLPFGNNIPEVSDEEQAEIEAELNAMTDEDQEVGMIHRVGFRRDVDK